MNKTWFILTIILFTSCTKDVSIDIADTGSKIVVNSFISPQGYVLVNVSKSISILAADTLNYIDNADVELFNDGISIGKLTHVQNGFYTLPANLVSKGEYSVTVSVPGMETVSSHDSIPVWVPILSFDKISVNDKYLYCEIKFHDIAQMSNYYLLEVTSKYPVPHNDTILSKQVELMVNDNIIENGSIGDRCTRIFFSDEKIQGKDYQLSFLLEKEPILKSLQNGSNILYINFKSISQNYYKYLKTYYESQTRQMDVFSNVTNGYGIFAGYNLSQDSIEIKQ